MGCAGKPAWPRRTHRGHHHLHESWRWALRCGDHGARTAGAFTIKERITYQREQKTLTRQVTDSRGYTYSQRATIGGDLGGFYNIFFESTPFAAGGTSVRVKHNIRTGSPLAYRVAALISVDGGAYTNYGNPWWRKDQ